MSHRYRKAAHSALELAVEHRAVGEESYRVRPVQDDERNVEPGALAHHPYHGHVVGIEPHAYILEVKEHHVKTLHHLLVSHLGAIERTDRDSGAQVHA